MLGMARFAHVLPTAKLFFSQGYPEIFGPVMGGGKGKTPACPDQTFGATWIFSEPLSNPAINSLYKGVNLAHPPQ